MILADFGQVVGFGVSVAVAMPSDLRYDSTRGQCVVMLLAALKDIGTMTSKQEAIRYISDQHYFHVVEEDREPYPSAVYPEPRWHVLLAWARRTV